MSRTFVIPIPERTLLISFRILQIPDGVERFEVMLRSDASWKDENGHQLAAIRGTAVALSIEEAVTEAYSRMCQAITEEELRRREVREQKEQSHDVDLGEIDLSSLGL